MGAQKTALVKSNDDVVHVGIVQISCTANTKKNLNKTIAKIREAASYGAQIVCLQELFLSEYFCQKKDSQFFSLAETIPGPTTKQLSALSKELNLVIVASIFEKRTAGLYHNTAIVIDTSGKLVGRYRKIHIPDDPYYHEKFYFTPGDLGFRSHLTTYGQVGVLICWDQWFPEAARLTTLKGAQIIFYPTAIGWLNGESEETNQAQLAAWETIQRGHAIANGVFVVAANRVGCEGAITFWGRSFLCDPFGLVLARASRKKEQVLVVPCNLREIELTRREWPFLRDRRVETYQKLSVLLAD